MTKIEKYVAWLEQIAADDSHGYDQKKRQGVDYDCSSFVANGLVQAGFNIARTSYTGNLYQQLLRCGFALVPSVTDRKRGDIFLTPGKHVVTCVDAKNIVHASINEQGKITGGKEGDQTGKEICIRSFYTPSYGWKYHLRYNIPEAGNTSVYEIALAVIAGKYGTGSTRKKNVEALGYNYEAVQKEVNRILKGNKTATGKTVHDVACEVIRGKWGNGKERESALKKAGYNPVEVQKMVNTLVFNTLGGK